MTHAKQLETFLLLGRALHSNETWNGQYRFVALQQALPNLEEWITALELDDFLLMLLRALKLSEKGLADINSIAMAISVCMKSKNHDLRTSIYKCFPNLCISSSMLFLCVAYNKAILLSRNGACKEDEKRGIWGEGFRNAVALWYSRKSSEEIARLLISDKKQHGWTHKDILKLIHFTPPSIATEAAINYFAFKKEKFRQKLDEPCENLAKKIDELKASQDPPLVINLLSELKMTLSPSGPSDLLKSTNVWAEYVQHIPLEKLINWLEYFSASKSMRETVLPRTISVINDADGSSVNPFAVYVALHRYENTNYQARKAKAIAKELKPKTCAVTPKNDGGDKETKEKKRTPYTACGKVVTALNELLMRSLNALTKTQEDWLLVLDMKKGGKEFPGSWHVPIGAMAASIAMYAAAVGANTTLVAPQLDQVKGDCKVYSDITSNLTKLQSAEMDVEKVLEWGLEKRKAANRIVLISDSKRVSIETRASLAKTFSSFQKDNSDARLLTLFPFSNSQWFEGNDATWIIDGYNTNVLLKFSEYAKGCLRLI